MATTDSKHDYPIAPNTLNRVFKADQIGEKWVSDISYIKVGNSWNYLTCIIDLADRKVVGWSVSQTLKTEDTILKSWHMAKRNRHITNDFIFHSDRGVQYASNKMTQLFYFNRKITQSMSRKANCWDNAVAESFFKTIKYEWLNRFKFDTTKQLNQAVNDYMKWYNTKGLHSTLGYKSPLEKLLEINKNNYQNVA